MPERRRHRSSAEASLRGIAAELGVYDDVFLCLSPGEPWLEHGIVEHRYKELRPTAYREMINRWGPCDPRTSSVLGYCVPDATLEPACDRRRAGSAARSRYWRVSAQRHHHVLGASPWPRGSADPDVGRLRSRPWYQPL